MLYGERATHAEAVDACKRVDATLVSIQTKDEQAFLDEILRNDYSDQWTLGKKNEGKTVTGKI